MRNPAFPMLTLLALAGAALAQGAVQQALDLRLNHARVVSETRDGKTTERLEAADDGRPGDVLEYRLRATNTTSRALPNVAIDLPVPKDTAYLDASATTTATGATLLASADGRKTFAAPPLKRKVVKDGKTVEEIIRPNEYTDLRWVLRAPLAPQQTLEFKARVKVK